MTKKIDGEKVRKAIADELLKPVINWQYIENLTKTAVEADPEFVRFTVDAGHIQRLGAELVGKQDTALAELIKNAFDSDSTEVRLKFSFEEKVGGTLVIEDNGSGMTDDVIRESWMRISTDAKISAPLSPRFGRARAGRKGIGRFSVQRLGQSLRLETRPVGETQGYMVYFDWDKDFNSGQDLSQVFSRIERFDKDPGDHGTKLSIFDLRDAWTHSSIERVWRSVMFLQPPFPLAKVKASATGRQADPGFSVVINGKSRDEVGSEFSIQKTFLNQAIAVVEADINPKGKVTFRVRSKKLELDEKFSPTGDFSAVGPVKVKAHYFIYTSSTLSGMSQQTAANMGKEFGGIRIYRNGFRVLPYGDRRDDWLELDRDSARRTLLVPASNLNFFGEVTLSMEDNPAFEETSSREGLLENTAYFQLKKLVREALEWAAQRVASFRNRKQSASQRNFVAETKKPSETIDDLLKTLEGGDGNSVDFAGNSTGANEGGDSNFSRSTTPPVRGNLPDASALLKKARDEFVKYEEAQEKKEEEYLEYQEMLRLLASLGLSISVFGHEVKGARDSVSAHVEVLSRQIAETADQKSRALLENYLGRLGLAMERVFDIGGYVNGLMSNTESRELTKLSVATSLQTFGEQFDEYMTNQGIEIHVEPDISPLLRTIDMHAAELDSVLLNFMTNAIKSMELAATRDRKVRIDAEKDGDHILVIFEDNGAGIAPEIEDRIFDAFFTTTSGAPDDGITGPGTGLGLKIVSDIASSYGGDVRVGKPSPGYNCRMEFRIKAAQKEG